VRQRQREVLHQTTHGWVLSWEVVEDREGREMGVPPVGGPGGTPNGRR
jgi:hypothetical protein